MRKNQGPWIRGWGFAMTLAIVTVITRAGMASAQARSTEDAGPGITIRVYNYAQVKPAVLVEAKKGATRIFAAAGIEASWLDCPLNDAEFAAHPSCQQPLGGADIVLSVIPRSMAEHFPLDRTNVGFARIFKEGAGGTVAVVFYHRVQQLARGDESAESLALGRAVVHEIGHLLLRTEVHSPWGIMHGDWSPRDFESPTAILKFTADQGEILRAEVRDRLAHQKAVNATPVAARR